MSGLDRRGFLAAAGAASALAATPAAGRSLELRAGPFRGVADRGTAAFLGIRYGASLRMGLQLHARSIGRGRADASWLPTLEAGLEPLSRAARSA